MLTHGFAYICVYVYMYAYAYVYIWYGRIANMLDMHS